MRPTSGGRCSTRTRTRSGLPNQGIAILYEVLNEQPGVLAERTYSVWPDLERLMRAHGVPQFTVDAHRPGRRLRRARRVSFSTELGYTNLLTALDLARHPAAVRGADGRAPGRARRRPRGVQPRAGRRLPRRGGARRRRGSGARRSPRLIREWKRGGLPRRPGRPAAVARRDRRRLRAAVLRRAVPARRPHRAGSRPTGRACPASVRKHTLLDLDAWPYPKAPVVPVAETVHERYSVEIFRGCTRGCRFCQAGMITRPVRERSITTVGKMVESGLAVDRVLRGRPALAVVAPTTARSTRSPSTSPTATRARTSGSRCRPPGWTPSTSPSPTSCRGTGSAPG